MNKTKILLAALATTALIASPHTSARAAEGDFISISAGYYDAFDDYEAMDFRAEYRPNSIVFNVDNLKPWAGLELTSNGSIWAGGGLLYDWNFTDNWYLTPSLGLGLYSQNGDDKDLDHPLEFRSQLEISYEFDCGSRAGLGFSHTSNASLGDSNPGTEVLALYWHIPLDKIF